MILCSSKTKQADPIDDLRLQPGAISSNCPDRDLTISRLVAPHSSRYAELLAHCLLIGQRPCRARLAI